MKKLELKNIAETKLEKYRKYSYSELSNMVNINLDSSTGTTENNDYFQFEISCFWDDKPNGNIRVMCSVDDGGWRAWAPVTESFIKSENGEFIDE